MRNQYIGFDDTWLVLPGIPVIAIVMSLMMYGAGSLADPVFFFSYCLPLSFIFTAIFWVTFRWVIIVFRRQFPGVGQVRMRIVFEVLSITLGYFMIKSFLHAPLQAFFGRHLDTQPDEVGMDGSSLIVSFMIVAIYEGMYFYTLFQKTAMEKVSLERANAESQLEGLRSHVNPHFLFNSLNTLAQLIREDAPKAERYVQRMSLVYRYILEMRDARLIPLDEELQFLESYLFLLHERFGDKVRVRVDIEPRARNLYIVPLALQLLIENAIKHNIASVEKPLTIEVLSHQERKLIVKNNLQRKPVPVESTGFGLPNIRARYAYYTDHAVDVITTHESFLVTLPLLTVPQEEVVTE